MVGHIHAGVAVAVFARGHDGHESTFEHEAAYAVVEVEFVGVERSGVLAREFYLVAGHVLLGVAGENSFGGAGERNDGSAVEIDGHAHVFVAYELLAVELNVLQIVESLGGRHVVENHPCLGIGNVDFRTLHDRCGGREMEVDVVGEFHLFAHAVDVLFLATLVVGKHGGLGSSKRSVEAAFHYGHHGEAAGGVVALVVVHADVLVGAPVNAEHGAGVFLRHDGAPHLHVEFPKVFVARALVVFPHEAPVVGSAGGEIFSRGLVAEVEVVGGCRLLCHEHISAFGSDVSEVGKCGCSGSVCGHGVEPECLVEVVADDVVFAAVNDVVGHSGKGERSKCGCRQQLAGAAEVMSFHVGVVDIRVWEMVSASNRGLRFRLFTWHPLLVRLILYGKCSKMDINLKLFVRVL